MGDNTKLLRHVHFDMVVSDTQQACQYYNGSADWACDAGDNTNYKWVTLPDGGAEGGLWKGPQESEWLAIPPPDLTHECISFFKVTNVQAYLDAPPPDCIKIAKGVHPRNQKPYAIMQSTSQCRLYGIIEDPSEPSP